MRKMNSSAADFPLKWQNKCERKHTNGNYRLHVGGRGYIFEESEVNRAKFHGSAYQKQRIAAYGSKEFRA